MGVDPFVPATDRLMPPPLSPHTAAVTWVVSCAYTALTVAWQQDWLPWPSFAVSVTTSAPMSPQSNWEGLTPSRFTGPQLSTEPFRIIYLNGLDLGGTVVVQGQGQLLASHDRRDLVLNRLYAAATAQNQTGPAFRPHCQ
jgi:hypothetical protein